MARRAKSRGISRTMRGDDQILVVLVVTFVIAAIGYVLLSSSATATTSDPTALPDQLKSWFTGLLDRDPDEKSEADPESKAG